MKKILLFFCLLMAIGFASSAQTTDTIRNRHPYYYYESWYDTCPSFDTTTTPYRLTNKGLSEYDLYLLPHYSKHRIAIKGIAAMVQEDTKAWHLYWTKLPEYLYAFQYHDTAELCFDNFELLDSVRWDTASRKIMELPLDGHGDSIIYCSIYEGYFKHPVYVQNDFYIGGSFYSNLNSIIHCDDYINTYYCAVSLHNWWDTCNRETSPVQIQRFDDTIYVYRPTYPWLKNSTHGYFLPIADLSNIDAWPNDPRHGTVIGDGMYNTFTYDTITALSYNGYHFSRWNDGDTSNPRIVFLTQDTSFTAIFDTNLCLSISTAPDNPAQGSTSGDGTFLLGRYVSIQALPFYPYRFSHWNDGDTNNPRSVLLTQDTAFTAFFEILPQHKISVRTSIPVRGLTFGSGAYYHGDSATLSAIPVDGFHFVGWNDGSSENPRSVCVTQDSSFIAFFSKGSVQGITTAVGPNFSLSPNPAHDYVDVYFDAAGSATLALLDASGREIKRTRLVTSVTRISTLGLPAGTYFVTLSSPQGTAAQKLVID